MMNKVFLGNLPWSVTTADLTQWLSEQGIAFKSVKVILDRETQRSRGFAFVEFHGEEPARAAIEQLNGAVMDGRTLFVNEAKNTLSGERQAPSGGGVSQAPGGGSKPQVQGRWQESTPSREQDGRKRGKGRDRRGGGEVDRSNKW